MEQSKYVTFAKINTMGVVRKTTKMGTNGRDAGAAAGRRTREDLGGIQTLETWHTDDAIHKNNQQQQLLNNTW